MLKKKKYSSEDMIDFGEFIRTNYHGVGAPKLISYNHTKYPHGTISDIFVYWSCDKEKSNNASGE